MKIYTTTNTSTLYDLYEYAEKRAVVSTEREYTSKQKFLHELYQFLPEKVTDNYETMRWLYAVRTFFTRCSGFSTDMNELFYGESTLFRSPIEVVELSRILLDRLDTTILHLALAADVPVRLTIYDYLTINGLPNNDFTKLRKVYTALAQALGIEEVQRD